MVQDDVQTERETETCRRCGADNGIAAAECHSCGEPDPGTPLEQYTSEAPPTDEVPVAVTDELETETTTGADVEVTPTAEGRKVKCPSCGRFTDVPFDTTDYSCKHCGEKLEIIPEG